MFWYTEPGVLFEIHNIKWNVVGFTEFYMQ